MAELVAQPTSIQSVYGLFRDDKLFVNRRYQRKLVWTLEEKQKLIESILKKYPIPAILLAEKEDEPGSYEIIDGLQRLHAIMSFVETSFRTLDGRLFDLDFFPTAKSVAEEGRFEAAVGEERLSQKEVTTILDYSLAMSVMRNATEAEINDVFDRINTYGHRLSDQERRQAGVQNAFSSMVRTIACHQRGDESADILLLSSMPSISIDLPMTRHGYVVRADETFWVNQGVLRATDLRDSADEQCIADIAACVVGGILIERSKDALDEIYTDGTTEAERVVNALDVYGPDRFADEFSYCVQEILRVCDAGGSEKLRTVIFSRQTTNAFPAVFAIILIAFHELIVGERKKVMDYAGAKNSLRNLDTRIETGRRSTSTEERRRNIDVIKALVNPNFQSSEDLPAEIYNSHSTQDIDALVRRSEIELPSYELKQGLLRLTPDPTIDPDMIDKVAKTICAIANNGSGRPGKILIGVCDKEADARRVAEIDHTVPIKVGRRQVVGINREAVRLGISTEQYFGLWKDGIRNSALSEACRAAVLANIDYNSYYGLGVIVISIPGQAELSYFGDDIYYREGDETKRAESGRQIAELAKRF